MSASAQKASSSRARARRGHGASRCDTAFTRAAKSAIVRLKPRSRPRPRGPLRLASCRPMRSSRQLRRGDVSTGCHCSSTMPSTCTGFELARAPRERRELLAHHRVVGEHHGDRIDAARDFRGGTAGRLQLGGRDGPAVSGSPRARIGPSVSGSGSAPSVGSRRAGTASKSASPTLPANAFSPRASSRAARPNL
jgi:hypothetical protein